MPPHLTEGWAAAYLQILIGLLVFALGIPAFIFQLIVREDIRHVTEQRMNTRWGWVPIGFLALAALAFVWWLHPSSGEEDTLMQRWLASLLITLVPLLVAGSGFYQLRKYEREKVVASLRDAFIQADSGRNSRQTANAAERAKREDILREKRKRALHDLIYLGEHGRAGNEKQMVLNAFESIAKFVQSREDYQGEELEYLIQSLPVILQSGETKGDDKNYCLAAEMLKKIQDNCSRKRRAIYDDDVKAIRRTLKALALEAMKSKLEHTVLRLLDASVACNSDIVFTIGVAALQAKRFLIATSALSKLETMVIKGNGLGCDETSYRLLGLLAHFAASGKAATRRAETFFSQLPLEDPTLIGRCLNEAFTHYYDRTYFETADYLHALIRRIETNAWPAAESLAKGAPHAASSI